jgi:hypothetical protein
MILGNLKIVVGFMLGNDQRLRLFFSETFVIVQFRRVVGVIIFQVGSG